MLAHVYYYAKSYFAALSTGILYLATVIGPDIQFSDLAHVSLLHWIGFVGCVLGVGAGVAVVTNGDKPSAGATASAPAATAPLPPISGSVQITPAPAATYPSAAVAAAEVSAPEITAPEVTPTVTPAQ